MKDPCADYIRQVRRYMSCPGWEKKRLLSGLESEMAEAFPGGALSVSAVVSRFGPPLTTARELEAGLPPERLEQYVCQKRLLTRVALTCAAVIVILSVSFYVYLFSIGTFNTTYIVTSIY